MKDTSILAIKKKMTQVLEVHDGAVENLSTALEKKERSV
jgi:hypothetical protein